MQIFIISVLKSYMLESDLWYYNRNFPAISSFLGHIIDLLRMPERMMKLDQWLK